MKLSVDPTHRKIHLTHGVETIRLEIGAAWRLAVDILAAVNELDGNRPKATPLATDKLEATESAG
jgi:hypothetical protein